MHGPVVYAVVLNWRDGTATLACLRALAASTYPSLHIVVVDNGSTDRSADTIAALPGITLVRNGRNLGFTGGVNVGIRLAMARGADFVWILNSDATVRPDVLTQLVATAQEDPRAGLISPVFHDPDIPGQAEFCLGRFDPRARHANQTADPDQARDWQQSCPDQIVLLGTALLVRRAVIETIGLLDERFFAYVEDVDYCLRSLAAGFRNVAVPTAIVYHRFKRPVTEPGHCPLYLHYFMSRNYLLLWRKLPGPVLFRKATLWLFHERLRQVQRMEGNQPAIDAVLAGLWDGLRGLYGPYDPRRRMPWPFRALLGRHPDLWLRLLSGKLPVPRHAA